MTISVKTENLHRSFPRSERGLKGLNFEIRSGERVGLWGPNGSGKTTLLRTLSALLLPSQGEVWICGHSTRTDASRVRSCVSWMPAHDLGFFPRLSGEENLYCFAALRGLTRAQATEAIRAWTDLPAFQEALRTPFFLCSTGMRHLLSLCRALLEPVPVLLLDEPTRSLDRETAGEVRNRLLEKTQNRTVIFASHLDADFDVLAGRRLEFSEPGMLRKP